MPPPWTDPRWKEEAERWIRDHAEVVGEIEQPHVAPWSTVMRVPSAEGDLWFKAVAPFSAFEPRLTALLAQVRPDCVPEVIAADFERAWMLMRDGGRRLREVMTSAADAHHWERVLPRYAELQIAVAPQVDELLELGVPDGRLAGLPARVERLLENRERLMIDQAEGLTSAQHEDLLGRLPEVRSLVDRLAAAGIPETIQHDDLHDGQVFIRNGDYLVFDWGDAVVSHPFHTLTVTLRAAAWRLGLEPGGPEIIRLRDAYLEPFGRPDELAPVVEIAYRTGTLGRALAWDRLVAALPPEEHADYGEAVPYGLQRFLQGGPIGTWE
jgi:hypothetical protein